MEYDSIKKLFLFRRNSCLHQTKELNFIRKIIFGAFGAAHLATTAAAARANDLPREKWNGVNHPSFGS